MKITFVRHGETSWNLENRLQGQVNEAKLNQNGIEQANNICKKIGDRDFDLILVSPLDRAKQTAQIININNKKVIIDERLIERGYGDLEGEKGNSGKYKIEELWDYDKNYNEKNVEPVRQLFKRVYMFLDDLISKNNYKEVLIVSHSGVGIALRTFFEGFPIDKDLLKFATKNGEILEYDTSILNRDER